MPQRSKDGARRSRAKTSAGKSLADVTAGASELADVLGLTPRRLQQLVDEDVAVRKGRGTYAVAETVRRYVKSLRAEVEEKKQVGPLDAARIEKLAVDRARAEVALARERGEVVPIEWAVAEFERQTRPIRAGLQTLPSNLTQRVVGRDPGEVRDVIQQVVEDLIANLHGLADDIEADDEDPADDGDDGDGDE